MWGRRTLFIFFYYLLYGQREKDGEMERIVGIGSFYGDILFDVFAGNC